MNFVDPAVTGINIVLMVIALVVEAVALVHCLRQRPDAFTAIGTLAKGGWLVILALALPVTYLFGLLGGFLLPIGLIFFGASLFYLLDVRNGIKELLEGRW
jgi:hypothetical protein